VNWLADPAEAAECSVKVRSMRAPVPARVAAGVNGVAVVELLEPEEAVAPGQACVFYKGARVLGGGWISRDKPLLDSP
jgi:tRNA-specific 2-thiouridylase